MEAHGPQSVDLRGLFPNPRSREGVPDVMGWVAVREE